MSDFLSVNRAAFEDNGIAQYLTDRTEPLFSELCRIMQQKNEEMNVTAITDDDGISRKHFCDCVFLSSILPEKGRMADIGCGGGFPCLPVAITHPGVLITAIDSTAKKVKYVEDTAASLGLDNLKGIAMRAEDGAHAPEHRECYDIVTARAVAALAVLCELCLPYLKVGGSFYAMKGKGAAEELETAKGGIALLGGRVKKIHEFALSVDGEVQTRYIIEIEKTASTPVRYPRPYAKIKKNPL